MFYYCQYIKCTESVFVVCLLFMLYKAPVEIALVVLGSVFGIVGLGALIVLGVPRLIAAGGIASSLPVTPAAVRPQIYPPRSFGTRFSPLYGRPQGQQRFLNRV